MVQKKNIVLADCHGTEIRELVESLNSDKKIFEIRSHISNWKRKSVFTELRRYFMYFFVALCCFLKRGRYDVIIGWQQFYTLIICFFCSVFSVKKTARIIALNFTYKEKKGKFLKIYRWFMGKCVSEKYMDFLHVLSNEYAEYISKEFSYPRDRIIVTSFGVKDRFSELSALASPNGYEKESYALAIGRSNRDYDFLIRAWKNIDYPLVIISDTYKKTSDHKNITVFNNIAGEESNKWISNCGLLVLPIDDGAICSGDTVLLTAMSLQRKIIVTVPSTLSEMYVQNNINAVLVEKDEREFAETVKRVLYSKIYSDLGKKARESYLKSYTIGAMGRAIYKAVFDTRII